MGKAGLYVKISILILALVIVFIAIKGTTTDKVQGAFQALGIETSGTEKNSGHGSTGSSGNSNAIALKEETARTLCRTRVHAIRFANGDAVVEKKDGMKLDWTAESAENAGTPRSLGYLEVEKWFSKHCTFLASPAPPLENPEPSNEPVKFALVEFIDNGRTDFYREGDAIFTAADPKDRFTSPDLMAAMNELRSIAGFAVDSKDR